MCERTQRLTPERPGLSSRTEPAQTIALLCTIGLALRPRSRNAPDRPPRYDARPDVADGGCLSAERATRIHPQHIRNICNQATLGLYQLLAAPWFVAAPAG